MERRKFLILLVLMFSVVLMLAACTTKAPDTAQPNTGQQIQSEKVLYLGRTWEDKSWDPATFTSSGPIALAPMIYENLAVFNSDGSSSPQLAESWDISADTLTYTFHLRQGVQWHGDYGEFNSEDVKFSFERHRDETLGSLQQETLGLANIAAIDTPDKYTVVFKLNAPDVDFITRCSIYSSLITSKAAFDKLGLQGYHLTPIGTGPFAYVSGTPGSRTEAVKFDHYWGNKPKVDRVVHQVIPDQNTLYTAFENGELDLIHSSNMDKVTEFLAAGKQALYVPSLQLLYIGVNMKLAPFDNEVVRQAYFHAINPSYYVEQIFLGKESIPSSYIPEQCKYALTGYFSPSYNPQKAKEMLAQAGYPNGINITLWAVNDELSTAPALITENQLKESGFIVDLQMVDFGVFIDKVRSGAAAMWLLYNSTNFLGDDTVNRYTSYMYPGSNWCGVTDSDYDAKVTAGLTATTEADKRTAFQAAQKRLIDLNVLYPATTFGDYTLMQPNISGVTIKGDLYIDISNADKN
ncbi:MAG: ABC transporter substrate-binding protein [Clostridiales bacterium]|nr:ABC transporter substrate-binding protein [Clostridiales bacterium]